MCASACRVSPASTADAVDAHSAQTASMMVRALAIALQRYIASPARPSRRSPWSGWCRPTRARSGTRARAESAGAWRAEPTSRSQHVEQEEKETEQKKKEKRRRQRNERRWMEWRARAEWLV